MILEERLGKEKKKRKNDLYISKAWKVRRSGEVMIRQILGNKPKRGFEPKHA